jgi:hypothetical protein
MKVMVKEGSGVPLEVLKWMMDIFPRRGEALIYVGRSARAALHSPYTLTRCTAEGLLMIDAIWIRANTIACGVRLWG